MTAGTFFSMQFNVWRSRDFVSFSNCVHFTTSGDFELVGELFKETALDLIITFDPRHKNSQVAIGNITKRGQHVLCLYSLKSRKIVQKTYGPQYQRTQNLVFTQDGDYLAALLVTYTLGEQCHAKAGRKIFLVIVIPSQAKSSQVKPSQAKLLIWHWV